ncbi:MAG: hypothetical protein MI864_11830 [Pseudomonadales bacterium]|nr:hypothetical protein [Pseudomonadales bacterium]
MTKVSVISLIIGLAISLLHSISTTSTKGWNVLTGEPLTLKEIQATYAFINENGVAGYLANLLPVFIVATLASCMIGYFWVRRR